LLWQLITAPEGVAAGLNRLAPDERALAGGLVRPGGRLSPAERIDIYADMYFYRLLDCLKEDFPAVCAVVGDTRFHNLITDYLVRHPPSHFSLRYAGRHLPAVIAAHSLSEQWPYLSDLAALEWSVLEAFDAADVPPLTAEDLVQVPEERWPELCFQLVPSVELLYAGWRVQDVWQQMQAGESILEPPRATTVLRIWRQDLRVFHRSLDAAEAAALAAIGAGGTFAEVCEQVVAVSPENAGLERIFQLIGEWVTDGVLAALPVAGAAC
jgi:hypothetical protein